MDREPIRKEIATFLRENTETVAEELEMAFVQEYPRARANVMEVQTIHAWSLQTISYVADAIETGDLESQLYLNNIGDSLEDPYETELTMFASQLSSILFIARHIAPILMSQTYTEATHAREIVDELEAFAQSVIEANCDLFKREMSVPRALSRGWKLLGTNRNRIMANDSPAKRRMKQERYNRIVKSTLEPAKPQGDQLTPREREVLVHIVDGRSNAEIAAIMGIAETTVKKHVSHIFDKYNVFSRTELVARVRERQQ